MRQGRLFDGTAGLNGIAGAISQGANVLLAKLGLETILASRISLDRFLASTGYARGARDGSGRAVSARVIVGTVEARDRQSGAVIFRSGRGRRVNQSA